METNSDTFKHSLSTLGEFAAKGFVTAHLLTADAREAQRITVEWINSWNSGADSGGNLVLEVLAAAILPLPAAP